MKIINVVFTASVMIAGFASYLIGYHAHQPIIEAQAHNLEICHATVARFGGPPVEVRRFHHTYSASN